MTFSDGSPFAKTTAVTQNTQAKASPSHGWQNPKPGVKDARETERENTHDLHTRFVQVSASAAPAQQAQQRKHSCHLGCRRRLESRRLLVRTSQPDYLIGSSRRIYGHLTESHKQSLTQPRRWARQHHGGNESWQQSFQETVGVDR